MMWNTCASLQNWLEKEILKAIIVRKGSKKKKKKKKIAYNIPRYHLEDNDWEPHQFCHIRISPARLPDNYIS